MQLHVSMLDSLQIKQVRSHNSKVSPIMSVISETIRYKVFNLSHLYVNYLTIVLYNVIHVIFLNAIFRKIVLFFIF